MMAKKKKFMSKISRIITYLLFISCAVSIDASKKCTISKEATHRFNFYKPLSDGFLHEMHQETLQIQQQDNEFAARLSPKQREAYRKFKLIKINRMYGELSFITRRDDEFVAMLSPKEQEAYKVFRQSRIDALYAK